MSVVNSEFSQFSLIISISSSSICDESSSNPCLTRLSLSLAAAGLAVCSAAAARFFLFSASGARWPLWRLSKYSR